MWIIFHGFLKSSWHKHLQTALNLKNKDIYKTIHTKILLPFTADRLHKTLIQKVKSISDFFAVTMFQKGFYQEEKDSSNLLVFNE